MKKKVKKTQSVVLRVEEKMLSQIDQAVDKRAGLSRHAWLIEAIDKHLKKSKRA